MARQFERAIGLNLAVALSSDIFSADQPTLLGCVLPDGRSLNTGGLPVAWSLRVFSFRGKPHRRPSVERNEYHLWGCIRLPKVPLLSDFAENDTCCDETATLF